MLFRSSGLYINRISGLAGNDTLRGGRRADRLQGDGGNDQLLGEGGDDHLDGGSGDDLLIGGEGADQLISGSGDDQLIGGEGADLLISGGGNDRLSGGFGNDTYRISGTFSRVLIDDQDFTSGNHDRLEFESLRSSDLLRVENQNASLSLQFQGGGQVFIPNYFSSSFSAVESFHFADGVSWGQAALQQRVQML